jgi:hypothetical protein
MRGIDSNIMVISSLSTTTEVGRVKLTIYRGMSMNGCKVAGIIIASVRNSVTLFKCVRDTGKCHGNVLFSLLCIVDAPSSLRSKGTKISRKVANRRETINAIATGRSCTGEQLTFPRNSFHHYLAQ